MTDHLEGRNGYIHELLTELDDEQLVEQIALYREQRKELEGLDAYHVGKMLGAAIIERDNRSRD